MSSLTAESNHVAHADVVVIGAGFAGLYALHRLREMGLKVRVFEAGADIGGVWYWNRYPGARCDSESIYYNFMFSPELFQEWTWSSRYPEQPEILRYLNFVADKFDLRRDIQLNTRVLGASFDEGKGRWKVDLEDGSSVDARFLISGVGCLSTTNVPKLPGLDTFKGEWHHTGNWPLEGVDFSGKRVGIIGTGSSGIQSIPVIAAQAAHVTVFQRTPQYTVPARNHPYAKEYVDRIKADYASVKAAIYGSWGGEPFDRVPDQAALSDTEAGRNAMYQRYWDEGGHGLVAATYCDLLIDPAANATVAEFIRAKIRETVKDPETARKLLPTTYYGTKRPILDTNYYETYNRDNVSLVDIKATPIEKVVANGVRTRDGVAHELDALVFATGYDGMTGTLLKLGVRGRGGVSLREAWADGAKVRTYLGLATSGFPNFFMITGPESPSVMCTMPISIEQHVDWIAGCIGWMNEHGIATIEPDAAAQEAWSARCDELANATLYPKTESWYTGANIADKPKGRFPIYLGGFPEYQQRCSEVASGGYRGFVRSTAGAAAGARVE